MNPFDSLNPNNLRSNPWGIDSGSDIPRASPDNSDDPQALSHRMASASASAFTNQVSSSDPNNPNQNLEKLITDCRRNPERAAAYGLNLDQWPHNSLLARFEKNVLDSLLQSDKELNEQTRAILCKRLIDRFVNSGKFVLTQLREYFQSCQNNDASSFEETLARQVLSKTLQEFEKDEEETRTVLAQLRGLENLSSSDPHLFTMLHLDTTVLGASHEHPEITIPFSCTDYMMQLLRSLPFINLFSDLDALNPLLEKFLHLQVTIEQLQNVKQASCKDDYRPVTEFAKEVAEMVYTLTPGYSYLIPVGWGTPSGRQELYCEFVKCDSGNYDLYIYDAGKGAETHTKEMGLYGTKAAPFAYYKNITPQKLFLMGNDDATAPISPALFEKLLLLQVKPLYEPNFSADYNSVKNCFIFLDRFEAAPESQDLTFFIDPSQSESSTIQSLNCFILGFLQRTHGTKKGAALYDELSFYSKLLNLTGEYEKSQSVLVNDPEKRYQLSCAARFFLRHTLGISASLGHSSLIAPSIRRASSRKAVEILIHLDTIERQLADKRVLEEKASFKEAIEATGASSQLTKELITKACNSIQELPLNSVHTERAELFPDPLPMRLPEVDFKDPGQITQYLKDIYKHARAIKELTVRHQGAVHYKNDADIYLSAALAQVPLPSPENVWSLLSAEQKGEILRIIQEIERLVDFSAFDPPAATNTAMTLVLLALHLKGEQLYTAHSQTYQDLQKIYSFCNNDFLLFQRRQEIISYIRRNQKDAQPPENKDPLIGSLQQKMASIKETLANKRQPEGTNFIIRLDSFFARDEENYFIARANIQDPVLKSLALFSNHEFLQLFELFRAIENNPRCVEKTEHRDLLDQLLYYPIRSEYSLSPNEPYSSIVYERSPLFQSLEQLKRGGERTNDFWKSARQVVLKGMDIYSLGRKDQEPILDCALWFVALSQKLRIAYLEVAGEPAAEFLPDERALLKKWLLKEGLSADHKRQINSLLLQHYRQKPFSSYSDEEWIDICSIRVPPRDHGTSVWKIGLENEVKKFSPERKQLIAEGVLKANRYQLPPNWVCCQEGSSVLFKDAINPDKWVAVNLHNGSINAPGADSETYLSDCVGSIPDGKRLFENRNGTVRLINNVAYFEDPLLGKLQLHSKNLYREIEGKFYRYVPLEVLERLAGLPKKFLKNFSFWVPHDPENPTRVAPGTIVLTNLKTGSNDYIWDLTIAKGIASSDRSFSAHTLSNAPFLSLFSRFEEPSQITFWQRKANEQDVVFDRIHNQKGEALTLTSSNDKDWFLSHNSSYKLVSLPQGHPLGAFKEALFFKHCEQERYKVLLTYKPLQAAQFGQEATSALPTDPESIEYLEYDWDPEGDIESPSSEASLYLSGLFLLQKDYKKSLHHLKTITRTDILTKRLVDILEGLFFNQGTKDLSPNYCALVLQAYIRAKRINPLQIFATRSSCSGFSEDVSQRNFQLKPDQDALVTLNNIYKKYLENLSLVDKALRIPLKEELFFLKKLAKEGPLNRIRELEGEETFEATQSFVPSCTANSNWGYADWREISSFGGLKLFDSLSLEESLTEAQKPLPGAYTDLDLKKHFLECYHILHNNTPDNESKRCELIYHIMTLAKSPDSRERNRAPVKLVEVLFKVYKDPTSFRKADDLPKEKVALLAYLKKVVSMDLNAFKERLYFYSHMELTPSNRFDEPLPPSESLSPKISSTKFSLVTSLPKFESSLKESLPERLQMSPSESLSDLNLKTHFAACYDVLRNNTPNNNWRRFELMASIVELWEKEQAKDVENVNSKAPHGLTKILLDVYETPLTFPRRARFPERNAPFYAKFLTKDFAGHEFSDLISEEFLDYFEQKLLSLKSSRTSSKQGFSEFEFYLLNNTPTTEQAPLPQFYDQIDLKKHFFACYRTLRDNSASNQTKRLELMESLICLWRKNYSENSYGSIKGNETSHRRIKVNQSECMACTPLVDILLKVYKAPHLFPETIELPQTTPQMFNLLLPFLRQQPTAPTLTDSKTTKIIRPITPLHTDLQKLPSKGEFETNLGFDFTCEATTPSILARDFLQSFPLEKNESDATYSFSIQGNELTEEERLHLKAIKTETAHYQEDCQYGLEEAKREFVYKLKPNQSLEGLKETIERTKNKREHFCKALEKRLLEAISKSSSIPEGEESQHLQEKRGNILKPSLIDLIRACQQPSKEKQREAFRAFNSTLTNRQIEALRHYTLLYIQESVYLKQLQRSLTPLTAALKMGDFQSLSTAQQEKYSELCQDSFAALSAPRAPGENTEALLFEYLSGLQVRPEQTKIIQDAFRALFDETKSEKGFSYLFQRMMGAGKTSVALSQLMQLASQKKRVPLFLCHHSQFNSVIGNLKKFQQERFAQELIRIDYTRDQLANVSLLQHLYNTLEEAHREDLALIMKTPMLQILQLEFLAVLEAINSETPSPDLQVRADALQKILRFIKEKSIGILDEADLNLHLLTGVHFPLGSRHRVAKERIQLVQDVFTCLATDPELKALVKLEENRQMELTEEQYKDALLPKLAQRIAERFAPFTGTDRQGLCAYLMGEKDASAQACYDKLKELFESDKEENSTTANLVATAKELLIYILPVTLSKKYNTNYGREPREGIRAIPYLGVGIPATTEFANSNVSLCYCFQSALNSGIQETQFKAFLKKMTEAAENIEKAGFSTFRNSMPAREFFDLTGVYLDEVQKPGMLRRVLEIINRDPKKQLEVEAATGALEVTYHEHVLSSDPFALIGQLCQIIGCSATLNMSTLPLDLKERLSLERGVEGKIIHKLLNDFASGQSRVHVVPTWKDLASFLKKTLEDHPEQEKLQGLADTGAFFWNYSNLEVADAILEHYQKKDRIKGVLFYQKNEQTGEEGFFIKKKGSDLLYPLKNTSREEIERCGLQVEDLFIYYDELRCTGTDIPQKPDAINLLTVDPCRMSIRNATQGALRARGFFQKQRVDFVVNEETKDSFLGREQVPSPLNIIRTLIKNQALQKVDQTPRAFFGQARNSLRQMGIDELLLSDDIDTYRKWRDHFLTPLSEEKGFALYGKIEGEAPTVKVIENEVAAKMHQLSELPGVKKEQQQKLKDGLEKVTVAAHREPFLKATMLCSRDSLTLAEVEVSHEVAVDVMAERETSSQVEIRQELQIFNCAPGISSFFEEKLAEQPPFPAEFIPWSERDVKAFETSGTYPTSLTCYEPSLTIQDRFLKVYKPSTIQTYYSTCFRNSKLRISLNQAMVVNIVPPYYGWLLHPLHELCRAKPAHYLLINRKTDSYTLISRKEANFWAGQIQKSNLSPDVQLLTTEGVSVLPGRPAEMTEELKELLWEANFFNGNLSYLIDQQNLSKTKEKLLGSDQEKDLKRHYLRLRSVEDPLHSYFFQKILPGTSKSPNTGASVQKAEACAEGQLHLSEADMGIIRQFVRENILSTNLLGDTLRKILEVDPYLDPQHPNLDKYAHIQTLAKRLIFEAKLFEANSIFSAQDLKNIKEWALGAQKNRPDSSLEAIIRNEVGERILSKIWPKHPPKDEFALKGFLDSEDPKSPFVGAVCKIAYLCFEKLKPLFIENEKVKEENLNILMELISDKLKSK